MLALIVGNCVLMAMKDPLAAQQARADWRPWVEGARARAEWRADLRVSRLVQPAWSQSAELTFTVLFTTECCLKMVAMGLAFESKTTYFRDAWNWLDALTVGVAWLALLPDAALDPRAEAVAHGAARQGHACLGGRPPRIAA